MYSKMTHMCTYMAYTYTHLFIHIYTCTCQLLQSCLTFQDPMDCSPPGSSVYGIFQAKVVEWVSMPSSRGSFWPRDWTRISCASRVAGGFFTCWVTGEALTHMHTHTHTHTHTHKLLHIIFHYRLLQDTEYSFLGYTVGPCWLPIFCIVILWPPPAKSWLIGKDPDAGRDRGQEKNGTTEDEVAG